MTRHPAHAWKSDGRPKSKRLDVLTVADRRALAARRKLDDARIDIEERRAVRETWDERDG